MSNRRQLARLGDICSRITDGTHQPPAFVHSGIPFLFISNIVDGRITFDTQKFITEETHAELTKRCPIAIGDILYTTVGSYGNAAVVEDGREFAFQRHIAHLKPDSRRVDSRYLRNCLASSFVRKQVDKRVRGIAQKTLNLADLREVSIPLPPLDEQRRIAAILDAADSLRAKRHAALAKLDQLAQSIFIEMFGDPASNPKGLPMGRLGDAILSASDGPHVSPKYSDSGIPFLSTRHVRPGKIIWEDLKYISAEEAAVQWKKCKPAFGDVLYTKGGTTGIAAAVDTETEFAVWVHVALLKPKHDLVDPIWLEAMLNSQFCYRQSQRFTHGIANRDLGLKRMVNIEMFLPPIDLQQSFVRRAKHVGALRSANSETGAKLDVLFASLQHRAFRGEL